MHESILNPNLKYPWQEVAFDVLTRRIIEELTKYWPGDYTIVRHSSQPFIS
jgi:hypothetical protein